MIDTVHIVSQFELLGLDPTLANPKSASQLPPRWYFGTDGLTGKPSKKFILTDPETGYRASGKAGEVQLQQASLPRLLHGSNGLLIKSQAELDRALTLMEAKASEISHFSPEVTHFSRVDLVWQIEGNPAEFILAHRHARHPRIRKDPTLYEIKSDAHSLAITGSKLRISIYDKIFEQFKHKGNVVRIEVQLRGEILKELLGRGQKVTSLNFDTCYQAFRKLMLGFSPTPIPKKARIAEFLAIAENKGWNSGGITAWEIYTDGMTNRSKLRLQKAMAAFRPTVHEIDWTQLLPSDHPPEPVDIPAEERTNNRL